MGAKKNKGGRPATGQQFVPGYAIAPEMRKRFRRMAERHIGADKPDRALDYEAARIFRRAVAFGEKIMIDAFFDSLGRLYRDNPGIEDTEAQAQACREAMRGLDIMLESMWRNPDTGESGHEILEEGK